MNIESDVIVIGAGVVGCSIARELSRYKLKVIVLEKEGDVAEGISKANSGVIHAGFNVKKGTLKAKFNLEGLDYFPKLAQELGVPYRLVKKLVVAKDETELVHLSKLLKQGEENGCQGLSIINRDQIDKIQPGLTAKYALFSEKTAIISPFEFTIALAENSFLNGVSFCFYSEVVSIEKREDFFSINNEYLAKVVVNAAGLCSDKISGGGYKLIPVKGEYLVLDSDNDNLLKTAVYPVPPQHGAGLGIHLTPTIDGNILIGPSAEYVNDSSDVANTKEVIETLKRESYDFLPSLRNVPIIKSFSGIRPKLGSDRDFIVEESQSGFINLIGIESPGLTSSPAIAKHIVENMISNRLPLVLKSDFFAERKSSIRTQSLPYEILEKLADEDKNYGEVVCRCEQVTKAEILSALHSPLKRATLNSIKKRTRCMMGRCQGGFCKPKIFEIMMEELKLKPNQILQNEKGSNALL